MSKKLLITGRDVGECAKTNGAVVHDMPNDRVYIENPQTHKAVIIPGGHLQPRAAFHIGVLVKWILLVLTLLGTYAWAIRL